MADELIPQQGADLELQKDELKEAENAVQGDNKEVPGTPEEPSKQEETTLDEAEKQPVKTDWDTEKFNKALLDSQDGKLSDELMAEAYEIGDAKGVSKEVVDLYVEAASVKLRQASASEQETEAQKTEYEAKTDALLGSDDNLNAIQEWAGKNLDSTQVKHLNAQFKQGGVAGYMATSSLIALYQQATGVTLSEPTLFQGNTATGSGQGYASKAEVLEAMNVKDAKGRMKYYTDPAYQKEVADKLARSKF
jgi:hypothetical protein